MQWMMRDRARPALALLATVIWLGAAAPALAEEPEITAFELDNGLEVVVIPDRRAPVVTHMVWYRVGSADEEFGRSGYAHFVEHLLFKGTENHPIGEFSARIAEVGGRENAFTSYDYTGYFQQVAPQELHAMMHYEADRMVNLVLTDEVVYPELDVVIEERNSRVENSPNALLSEETNATLFQNHPYRIPIIGWMQEIREMTREGAMEFYRRHYGPNNAVVVIAGDVDADIVRDLAEATYGQVPRNDDIVPRVRPVEPEQHTSRTVTLRDPRVGVPSMSMSWIVPSYNTAEPGEAESLDLLAELLGGGVRSRAYQALVVEQGIATSVGAHFRGGALDDTVFSAYGSPRGSATIEDVERGIEVEIRRIAEDGVTEAELDTIKRRFMRSVIFARDDQSGMARIYGASLTTGSTVEDIAEWPDRIRAVTPEQVQQAAERHLQLRRAVRGYLLPEDGEPS